MRQSAWWLHFQMLYFFKTFGFPSGEFLYFLPFLAHPASCQFFFPGEGLLRSGRRVRPDFVQLFVHHSTLEKTPAEIILPTLATFFFFFFSSEITNLKTG